MSAQPSKQSRPDKASELPPFRPDKAAWEARIRAALKPVPKRIPPIQNHY